VREEQLGFATRAIHGPDVGEVKQRPASVPIYQTSTWGFDSADEFADVMQGRRRGYVYTRGYGNPTVNAFEGVIADLEGAESAHAFASGMAAIHGTLTTLARSGDRIVASRELYGGSASLLMNVLPRYGIETTFVDPHDPEAVREAVPGAAAFYAETIANPLVTVADLSTLATLCREAGVASVVDNTFASPALCNPIALGIDHVVHSATKYIGGHADLIGGVVCGSEDAIERVRATAIETGGAMQPLEAWLCLRGLATLELRMERHARTAQAIAEALARHPKVARTHYPGLPTHPQHDLARRQLRGFGGMIAFEVEGGVAAGARLSDALRVAWIGGSLGAAQTLVAHPASTTHRQLDADARRASGIADGLLRVSVGLEDPRDIIDDVEAALEKA
jgi:methionine-gamma-lyase